MSEVKTYPVSQSAKQRAWIDDDKYLSMYRRSIEDPDGFWAEQAEEFISWSKKWDKVQEWDYDQANIKWFINGKLNVTTIVWTDTWNPVATR